MLTAINSLLSILAASPATGDDRPVVFIILGIVAAVLVGLSVVLKVVSKKKK